MRIFYQWSPWGRNDLNFFKEKNCKKKKKKFKNNLGMKKKLSEKIINYMLNGKTRIIISIVGSIKKTQYK